MLVVVGGATGTGKSAAALDLAEAIRGRGRAVEIVNADAMQLYRGMDIGTAKLPEGERRGIRHRMLDVLDVTEDATVAWFQHRARLDIERVSAAGGVAILVGGTGLYIDAVVHRMEFPGTDPSIRARWEQELGARGPGALATRLREVDPDSAARIDPGDGRRLVRALEVWQLTGRPFSDFTAWANTPWRDYELLVLDEAQESLAPRLAARAAQMWRGGLLAETDGLARVGLTRGSTAGKAIGYAQALRCLDGEIGADEALEQTIAATIRYARRQRTWFRRYPGARWIAAGGVDPEGILAEMGLADRD